MIDRPSTSLSDVRRALILDLALLPGEGDVLTWQRRLANALMDAEANIDGTAPSELRRHRHLLRVMADGLVHRLVDGHTVRALSQHPGKPPSITAQGPDFDFVFECARSLLSAGLIPIIADLTTLIGVGDVVGVSPAGVVVLECKNTSMPSRLSTSGRLARQRERGEQAEHYLATGRLETSDGAAKQAFVMDLPNPDFVAVEALLQRCIESDDLVATHTFGENDALIACTLDTSPDAIAAALPDGRALAIPVLTFFSEVTRKSSHRLWAPSSYPVPGELRLRLLEGELQLLRLADLAALAIEFDLGEQRATLTPQRGSAGVQVTLDVPGMDPVTISSQVIDSCFFMPISVTEMRAALIKLAHRHVLAGGASTDRLTGLPPAVGDLFVYATAYRDGSLLGGAPDAIATP